MNTATERDAAAATARRLLDETGRATLATCLAGADGWPYASLVLVVRAADGRPLLLLSDLAEHSKNLAADDRASLLFDGTGAAAEPLDGPRLTVLGRLLRSADAADREAFVARHPSARTYASFGDFACYRMVPERAHFVGGFGRIRWLDWAALAAPGTPPATPPDV